MKKIMSKIVIFMLVICIVSIGSGAKTEAASYPYVSFRDDSDNAIASIEATVGDVVHINMTWLVVYNNEGYDINIYDSNGRIVASMSYTWTNTNYRKYLWENWDTSGLSSGEYTVEVTKKFYSLFRWNEAPTKSRLSITLKDASNTILSKGENITTPSKIKGLTAKNSGKKAIIVKFKKSKNAKKYRIQYSRYKNFKKTVTTITRKKLKYKIKNLKKNKKYYVRVCAVNGNKTSAWTKAKKVRIRK